MSNWEDDNRRSAVESHYEEDASRGSPPSNSRWGQDKRSDDYGNRREQRGRDGGGRGGNGGRSYDFKETIDLRSDCIGMIIGRGGSNIQRLQTDYNVRVDIDKNSGTVTVSGNSESDVQSALNNIKDTMDRAESRSSGGGGGGRGYGGGDGGGYRGGDRGSSYKSRYEPRENNDSYGRGGGGGNY